VSPHLSAGAKERKAATMSEDDKIVARILFALLIVGLAMLGGYLMVKRMGLA